MKGRRTSNANDKNIVITVIALPSSETFDSELELFRLVRRFIRRALRASPKGTCHERLMTPSASGVVAAAPTLLDSCNGRCVGVATSTTGNDTRIIMGHRNYGPIVKNDDQSFYELNMLA